MIAIFKKLIIKDIIFVIPIIAFILLSSFILHDNLNLNFIDNVINLITSFNILMLMGYYFYNNYFYKSNTDIKNICSQYNTLILSYGIISFILLFKIIAFFNGKSVIIRYNSSEYLDVYNTLYNFIEILILLHFMNRKLLKKYLINSKRIFSFILFKILFSIFIIFVLILLNKLKILHIAINIFLIVGYSSLIFITFRKREIYPSCELEFYSLYFPIKLLYIYICCFGNHLLKEYWYIIMFSLSVSLQFIQIKFIYFITIVNPIHCINEKMISLISLHNKVFQNIPYAVMVRSDSKILFVNDLFKKTMGIAYNENILGKNIQDIFIDYDAKQIFQLNTELNEQPESNIKISRYCYNNKFIDVEECVTCLPDTFEGEKQYLLIIRDLEEIKKYEQIILKLQEKEQEEQLKNEFISNISHEIRTPINVIYSAIQVIDAQDKKNNYNENKKYTKAIRQNCLRLIRLINNLIDITKIEGGFYKIEPTNFNLVNHVENITDSIADYIENKGLNVIFDTVEEDISVFFDEDSLERIMLNLLSNAIKYNKTNGTIFVKIDKDDNYGIIAVSDDGDGITQEQIDLIFNRFERLDTTLSRKTEGSGIGLNLIKSIIELNNGIISIDSVDKIGTKVVVKIPLFKNQILTNKNDNLENEIKNDLIQRIKVEFSDIYF